MTKKNLPSIDILRKLIGCDAEAGSLWWRERSPDMFTSGFRTAEGNCNLWNTKNAGNLINHINACGYVSFGLYGEGFLAHRVIWAMYHDEWPVDQIDHINHDRADNKIKNLRVVSQFHNSRNQSGINGVTWNKADSVWRSRINNDEGVVVYLGRFKCFGKAVIARLNAERDYGYYVHTMPIMANQGE